MKISIEQEIEESRVITPEVNESEVEKELFNIKLLAEKGRLEGEFKNISDEAYHHHNCPADSRSTVMVARDSIARYKAKKQGKIPWTTSPSKEFGKMCHTYILEPEVFKNKYCEDYQVPRPIGNAAKLEKNGGVKEAYKEWKIGYDEYASRVFYAEKTIVSKKNFEILEGIKESFFSLDILKDIFDADDVEFENSYFFTDPKTGLLLKFRPDIIIKSKKIIIDFKTAIDASPLGFGKSMANYYYDVQGAQYLTGAETLFGGDWTMGFVAAEKTAPYVIGLYALGAPERELGQEILDDTLSTIKEMPPMEEIKNSYSLEFKDCSLPAWCYTKGYR